jgi:hypothetical protein
VPAAYWAADRAKAGANGALADPQLPAGANSVRDAHGIAITEPHLRLRRCTPRSSAYDPGSSAGTRFVRSAKTLAEIIVSRFESHAKSFNAIISGL